MLKPIAAALAVLLFAGTAMPVSAAPMSALQQYKYVCASPLNFLSTVRKETVSAIGHGANVAVREICGGVNLSSFGNAGGLGKTIGANPTLSAALNSYGWSADDVVGIRISGGNVLLYVHRF